MPRLPSTRLAKPWRRTLPTPNQNTRHPHRKTLTPGSHTATPTSPPAKHRPPSNQCPQCGTAKRLTLTLHQPVVPARNTTRISSSMNCPSENNGSNRWTQSSPSYRTKSLSQTCTHTITVPPTDHYSRPTIPCFKLPADDNFNLTYGQVPALPPCPRLDFSRRLLPSTYPKFSPKFFLD